MPELFDMCLRAMRRDRAARIGSETFLHDRAFEDALERIETLGRSFDRALLVGSPNRDWPARLAAHAGQVEVTDPGPLFAAAARGRVSIEDGLDAGVGRFDLIVAVGTLDTVNALPLALTLLARGLAPGGLLIGAVSGGDTLPRLRSAMRAADAADAAGAFPHVHPRIGAAALAPLLEQAGLVRPVVDVDRVSVRYPGFDRLIGDLRAMGATNVLSERPRRPVLKAGLQAARRDFAAGAIDGRPEETFEILHFAAWKDRPEDRQTSPLPR